jgi:hypothetical protein
MKLRSTFAFIAQRQAMICYFNLAEVTNYQNHYTKAVLMTEYDLGSLEIKKMQ